jgi:hypothetical protein
MLAFALCLSPLGSSATIYVPDDYSTIQEAIDASSDHDTIMVAPGTYKENIDFKGKAITVESEEGPFLTIIDGNQAGSVASFQNGEDTDSVLSGFTLTNGFSSFGSGVFCLNASPSIQDNIVTRNRKADDSGGGIYCEGGSPIISNNIISLNAAEYYGGGIECIQTSAMIRNNIIAMNSSGGSGGGIGCFNTTPSIINNLIAGNEAVNGGAIGGGLSSQLIENSTIIANSATKGGGLYCHFGCLPIVTNTIFWDNGAGTGDEAWIGDSSTLTISYSDVKGGQAAIHLDASGILAWGSGMLNADPLFVQGPEGFRYLCQIGAGQPADSPCVDAGSDLASNLGMDAYWTRTDEIPDTGIVDMGYHHGPFTCPRLQVDAFHISEISGGTANFLLLGGTENADRKYILLGSVSGTDPGISLPGGFATMPLNWDAFTDVVLLLINTSVFSNFLGTLDSSAGSATAQLNAPPVPGYAGIAMQYAFCLGDPFDFVSNPVEIDIVP